MNRTANPIPALPAEILPPDPAVCRRARLSRDARFDGEFFIGVKTTGIYCRPICPARPPAEKNVLYYRSAAQAAQAGFRPCLRCRPESAPGSPAWNGTSTTVQRALQLVDQGALNQGSIAELAGRLGIGERYLRKLFQRELGVSPTTLALNQRLLFAKKLLAETRLPITEVAFAAGFGSVRRFNSAIQDRFRLSPTTLRREGTDTQSGAGIRLHLHYRPPYDWEGVVNFFGRHAIDGIEEVTDTTYRRAIEGGSIEVTPLRDRNALQLTVYLQNARELMAVVAAVRRMFDLDANPAAISEVLGDDRRLAPLLRHFPGIRAPGHWSLYESAVRGVVGQQVSIKAARGVLAKLARYASDGKVSGLDSPLDFPRPSVLARLADDQYPMPGKRRETLRQVSHLFAESPNEPDLGEIGGLPGIGPWTVGMISMRGLGQPDIFPNKDLGLERAWENLPGRKSRLGNQVPNWRPWGSYAANLLWRSLSI